MERFVKGDVVVLPFPFSADKSIILRTVGTVKPELSNHVIKKLFEIISQ